MTTTENDSASGKSDGEQRWKAAIGKVEKSLVLYKKARADGDSDTRAKLEKEIPNRLRIAGKYAPDRKTKEHILGDADKFEKGDDETRESMTHPLLQGLGILLLAPFALAGATIVAAGAIVYGAGKILMGVGDILTGGPFVRRNQRAVKEESAKDKRG